ncbi:hypothetical protein GOP47_0018164 [Adiantum capillus-veneris]|uniref:Uncharacterized protein n=1 Tax=Adiantum capillus-veneris TaxID=13818 RepID=A0A9D4UHX6_ADICA|nr:hypothetical protein GOP47_0018164 [Adiantum capillus-veneris]
MSFYFSSFWLFYIVVKWACQNVWVAGMGIVLFHVCPIMRSSTQGSVRLFHIVYNIPSNKEQADITEHLLQCDPGHNSVVSLIFSTSLYIRFIVYRNLTAEF